MMRLSVVAKVTMSAIVQLVRKTDEAALRYFLYRMMFLDGSFEGADPRTTPTHARTDRRTDVQTHTHTHTTHRPRTSHAHHTTPHHTTPHHTTPHHTHTTPHHTTPHHTTPHHTTPSTHTHQNTVHGETVKLGTLSLHHRCPVPCPHKTYETNENRDTKTDVEVSLWFILVSFQGFTVHVLRFRKFLGVDVVGLRFVGRWVFRVCVPQLQHNNHNLTKQKHIPTQNFPLPHILHCISSSPVSLLLSSLLGFPNLKRYKPEPIPSKKRNPNQPES